MEENNNSLSARIDYIDLFRAFGILIMIMGHSNFGSVFSKWIHCFHMPMFFVISGYFYKQRTFRELIRRINKTILLPYLVFGILHTIIYFAVYGYDAAVFSSVFWINTQGMPIAGALWFLTALYVSEALFWLINHLTQSKVFVTVLSLLIAIAGMFCATYLPFRLPFAIDIGMVGVGFFQFGRLLRTDWKRLTELKLFTSIVAAAFFTLICFVNGYVNMRQGLYAVWPLFLVCAMGMTVSFWNISRIIYSYANGLKFLKTPLSWLVSIGKNSIVFLCLNQLAILVNRTLLSSIQSNNAKEVLGKSILVFSLSVIELFIVQKIIVNTKLRIIIGRS